MFVTLLLAVVGTLIVDLEPSAARVHPAKVEIARVARAPKTVDVGFVRNGKLVRVERVVPRGVTPRMHALRELTQGPTREERARGLRTAIRPGVRLRSLRSGQGMWLVSFSRSLFGPGSDHGPVEYMIVSFPGNRFRGEIAPALGKLVESNTIRIIDLAFVGKDADGSVAAFELSDIDEDVRRGLEALGLEASGLLGEEDLMDAAAELEPGSSAAMLLWEDIWAAELAGALRGAGGELVAIGRIPHDVVMEAREALLSAANTTQEG